jgi:hypothetical protein
MFFSENLAQLSLSRVTGRRILAACTSERPHAHRPNPLV